MTTQIKENLLYEGETLLLMFWPPIPQEHPRIKTYDSIELEQNNRSVFSTACWRGYIAAWEIKVDQFYLVSVEGIYEIVGDVPIFADWFRGVLRISKGKTLQFLAYEQEIQIKIEAGKVVKKRLVDNRDKDLNTEQLDFDGDDW